MKNFDLEVVTPEKQLFAGAVQSVLVPGTNGAFQVLSNHAPIISTLGKGKVKILTEDGTETSYYTEDGVIEVLNNKAIILVEKVLES
ncbi:MAG: ATP synthase F1 subunit epsilon [Bacteroidota bacterium]